MDDDLHQSTYIPEIDKTTESSTRPSSRRRTKTTIKTTTTTSTTEMPGVEEAGDDNIISHASSTTDKPMLTFEGDYETIEKHKVHFVSFRFNA